MRAKRSKDKRLVDKFSRQRESLAAESRLHQPVIPSATAATSSTAADDDDFTHGAGDEEEDDIKASSCPGFVAL